jgi:hypothetical protein
MLDSELKINQFLVQYCRTLVGDIASGTANVSSVRR